MIRRPPRSTLTSSSAASDVYKRQVLLRLGGHQATASEPDTYVRGNPEGMLGRNSRRIPASAGVRSAFRLLHDLQAATVFNHDNDPPRDAGKMWSAVSAGPPQYPHLCPSRDRTPAFVHDGP